MHGTATRRKEKKYLLQNPITFAGKKKHLGMTGKIKASFETTDIGVMETKINVVEISPRHTHIPARESRSVGLRATRGFEVFGTSRTRVRELRRERWPIKLR